MKVFYSDHYEFPLPEGHRFPVEKYRLLRERLLSGDILSPDELLSPAPATRGQILLAHSQEYFNSFESGSIDPKIIRKIGFPWSHELHMRSLASVGGAVESAREAMINGVAGNLAGGTHHAFRDHGEGFCVYNDLAVVTLLFQQDRTAERIAIVDLDVHQGNGTSDILKYNRDVFIFSMHGKNNYPFVKIPSTVDIELEDNTEDSEYLERLNDNIKKVVKFEPEIILFIAGVDPLKEDRLGKLSLTKEGLKERDKLIAEICFNKSIPLSLALGGGYSVPVENTVEAYCNTYRAVKEIYIR
ncbi:MAG: histone deacetylase [Bacteroidetes bacterium]|nr:histone deacetylase [Bacteroidota bacterium]